MSHARLLPSVGDGVEVTHPSFDGGYSHSSPFGKSPLGYSSQIGIEGGSVCPFTVAQIVRSGNR